MGKSKDARQKVLRAAFEDIRLHGYQGANINRIAKESGVTKGALFYHFRSKRELGLAVVDEVISPAIIQQWLEPLKSAEDLLTCLQSVIRQMIRSSSAEQIRLGAPVLDLSLEMSPIDDEFRKRFDKTRKTWIEGVTKALRKEIERGVLGTDTDPRKTAIHILAFLMGASALGKGSQSVTLYRECLRRLIDFLDALRLPGRN